MKETQNFNFRILVVLPKIHFFVNNEKLNLNIFVTLFEHSTSMHHQEIASSNMTKDRRQQSRVKRHSIYIRTVVSSWRLFRLVYGPVGQNNIYRTTLAKTEIIYPNVGASVAMNST